MNQKIEPLKGVKAVLAKMEQRGYPRPQRPVHADSPLDFRKTLVLSTGHITKETNAWLAACLAKPEEHPECQLAFVDLWGGYGYIFYVDRDGVEGEASVPPDLRACLALARANGAARLELDCDVAPTSQLPTYDW